MVGGSRMVGEAAERMKRGPDILVVWGPEIPDGTLEGGKNRGQVGGGEGSKGGRPG